MSQLRERLRAAFWPSQRQAHAPSFVGLTGRRPARTLFETWLLAEVSGAGRVRRDRLVARLTDRWLREELATGAGTVDPFIWAPACLGRDVERLLAALEGDFLWVSAELPERSPHRSSSARVD